ncbi:hypothetical protein ABPG72_015738 [Tetrahymena utriculariae]
MINSKASKLNYYPRDTDITKYNSKVLYQNQGRKQVEQQNNQQLVNQNQGIKIVKTNQSKDTFRTVDPEKIEKEQPLFQHKKQVNVDYPTSSQNIFGLYYNQENNNQQTTLRNNRSSTSLISNKSPNRSQPLNLFAPDTNPPVYSTLNINSTSLKPEHFQKRLIKQNEFKMYDYGSSVNLPNQQVIREPLNDASQTERQKFNKAQTRKYQLDITSSIDCLPGVFYKSPQQFKHPPKKDQAFAKRLQISSVEKDLIKGKKIEKPKQNIKNQQSAEQADFDAIKATKKVHEKSRGQQEQQFELKDSQGPIKNPSHQYSINRFKTQVSKASFSSNTRQNFYKTNFILG